VVETSRSQTLTKQHGVADGDGSDEGFSEQASKSVADQEQWSKANAIGNSHGVSDMEGWGEGENQSGGLSDSPIIVDGKVKQRLRLAGEQAGTSSMRNGSKSTTDQATATQTDSVGGGRTVTEADAVTRSGSKKRMRTVSNTEGVAVGERESHKLMPLPKLVHVRQDTGQLQDSVNDQYERFACELSSLDRREAYVRVRGGKAMKIRSIEVREPFASVTAQMNAVAWFTKLLAQQHDYIFTPDVDDEPDGRMDDAMRKLTEEIDEQSEIAEESPLL